MAEIQIDPHVDAIEMPENLRVGLMVAEARKKCAGSPCPFDYAAFAFGQSPFHVPPPLARVLAGSTTKGIF